METRTLETPEADIVYDVQGPLPTADGRPPLFMIGQPMDAGGFRTLASYFPDRTVITYDPRGLGRSVRKAGQVQHVPTVQANDVHAVIEELGAGPVEMFASSGGAVTALALVAAYPNDVTILVAHEPPLRLPDAEAASRAEARFRHAYLAKGFGAGMAAFIAMTSWKGEFTEDYFAQPSPDPTQFGLPMRMTAVEMIHCSLTLHAPVTTYRPISPRWRQSRHASSLVWAKSQRALFTARTSEPSLERLGREPTVFPSHHGGFIGGDSPYAGKPEAFAHTLRGILG